MEDTNPQEVSLATFLLPEKVVEMEFPGIDGLKFNLCFLSRSETLKLRKKCLVTKYDQRTRKPTEELDDDKFLEEYTKAIIKGWSGFKFVHLKEFLLADVQNQNPDDEVPYTPANAKVLLENSTMFDDWLTEVVGDLTNFTNDN